jgi:CRISPR system Cascade subunit CasC
MRNNLFIDFHVLQTVPPSCINRDDTGRQKTAFYGGAMRARVSSQAWKRAVREYFWENGGDIGYRTLCVRQLLEDEILKKAEERGLSNEIDREKVKKLSENILGSDNPDNESDKKEKNKGKNKSVGLQILSYNKRNKTFEDKSSALFFISKAQVEGLADLALTGGYTNIDLKKVITDNYGIDIAMFGRMLAGDSNITLEASVQVAHAISTHQVNNKFDFYTAIDDVKEDPGAGMMGSVGFNSSTLYRYSTICVHDLAKNLKENPHDAVRRYAEAFICSMPSGKKYSNANMTLPYVVYCVIRNDRPVNLVGAFETPIPPKALEGYEKRSVQALKSHADEIYNTWTKKGSIVKELTIGDFDRGENVSFEDFPNLLDEIISVMNFDEV